MCVYIYCCEIIVQYIVASEQISLSRPTTVDDASQGQVQGDIAEDNTSVRQISTTKRMETYLSRKRWETSYRDTAAGRRKLPLWFRAYG